MARDFARIGTDMPHEDRIRALNVGPAWLYDRLLMSREMSRCAIVPFRPLLWADMQADATEKKVRGWLKTLADGRLVVVDERYAEVFVRTAIRHDKLLAQPNVVAALVSDYRLIASDQLRLALLTELRRIWGLDSISTGERGGWLLAMGQYPREPAKGEKATWPESMTPDALGRIRKAIGEGLRKPMLDALAQQQIEPFTVATPGGIPGPFVRLEEARGA